MTWDREQRIRLGMEKHVLSQEYPGFRFHDPLGETHVRGWWTAQSGRGYEVAVYPTAGFPDECPEVYITSPAPLRGYYRAMTEYGNSHAMHVLESDRPGWTKVCVYHAEKWHPKVSLSEVLIKTLLWLWAFDIHRDTGDSIDDILTGKK